MRYQAILPAIAFTTLLAAGCGGMHSQDMSAGRQQLQQGIDLGRTGLGQIRAGDSTNGLANVDQGRGMMGEGMGKMGLGCCLGDAGLSGPGVSSRCAQMMSNDGSMMGAAGMDMMAGLQKFDLARPLLTDPDQAVSTQAMDDMGRAMDTMERAGGMMMGMSHAMCSGGMMM